MADFSRSIEHGASFLNAILGDDDEAIDETVERVGGPQGVVLASSLLAIFVRETLGASITLEDVAAYAKKMSADLEDGPRRLALEDMLRTGAGFDKVRTAAMTVVLAGGTTSAATAFFGLPGRIQGAMGMFVMTVTAWQTLKEHPKDPPDESTEGSNN